MAKKTIFKSSLDKHLAPTEKQDMVRKADKLSKKSQAAIDKISAKQERLRKSPGGLTDSTDKKFDDSRKAIFQSIQKEARQFVVDSVEEEKDQFNK